MSSLRNWFSTKLDTLIGLAAAAVVSVGLVASAEAAAGGGMPAQVVPSKYAAIVVDTTTGGILYQINADARRYPASLTKMMTLYVMFEELERGRFKLSSPLRVSALAQRQSPTKLGLRAGETITAEEAIKGLITRSANDAAVAIAENVAGSIPAFAARMTRTAHALGMTNTHFNNPNGLPDPNNYATARDLMKLGVALQVRFPQYYPYFSIQSFNFRGHFIGNHNNLLGRVDGVDGIKTGYVTASGFNIVTSVKRDGRKLIVVVMGGKTAAQRDALVVQLVNAYVPKASRGRGYDNDLVADVRSAPRVAGAVAPARSEPAPEPEATIAHPRPAPRPNDGVAAVASIDPAAVETARAAPPTPARQPPEPPMPTSLASATLPANLARASLPSSASEAFADITPPEKPDPMGHLVARASASAHPYQIASANGAVADDEEDDTVTSSVTPSSQGAVKGWIVQIGSVGSEREAMSLLSRARSAVGSPLTRAHPVTEIVKQGRRTYVRARFAGFADQKAANRACSALKKNDFECLPMRL